MRALGHRLRDYVDNFRMRMPLDERAERHHEIDVFVSVEIPHVRPAAAFQYDRPRRIHGRATRG